MKHPLVSLELEILPDEVPSAVRLRRALKVLLRSFGLRCKSIRSDENEEEGRDLTEEIVDSEDLPF